ncbi:hypothetical protein [Niallia circulans]|uniref:hypothetical protein n=1 Tax=Niallia circulans TaxID=1397 RepID=UPI00352F05D8
MKECYDYMNKNIKYGSNFLDHGYKPVWVVFDEMELSKLVEQTSSLKGLLVRLWTE